MPGLEDLYREIILDHYRSPRNRGVLPAPPARRVEGFNPLCGDEVILYVDIDDSGRITDIKVDGQGCSISQSSASMMSVAIKGKPIADVRDLDEDPFVAEDVIELHVGAEYVFTTKIPIAIRGGFWRDPAHNVEWRGPTTRPDFIAESMLYPKGEDPAAHALPVAARVREAMGVRTVRLGVDDIRVAGNGDVQIQMFATGGPGTHLIDLYPLLPYHIDHLVAVKGDIEIAAEIHLIEFGPIIQGKFQTVVLHFSYIGNGTGKA